jgi:hypothetical protein
LGSGPADENPSDELGPRVPLSELRPGLRSTFLADPEEQGTLTVRRVIRTPAPVRHALPVSSASLGSGDLPRTPVSRMPLKPLADAVSVAELETALGATTTDSSSHRALFIFDQAVDVSGAVVRFDGDWTLVEVRFDGLPLDLAATSGEIRFPELPQGVREISIHYGTPGIAEGPPRIDRIAWPQLPSRVERWVWRIQTPPDRRVTEIRAPIEFEGGISRPPLRARLLAPLGREYGEPVFNPFRLASWGQLISSSGTVSRQQS